MQRVGQRPYQAKGAYVAKAQRLYDLRTMRLWTQNASDPQTLDTAWKYETLLPQALDALEEREHPLDGALWAKVLVPFVSSLFVRGLDFATRFRQRLTHGSAQLDQLFTWPDNAIVGMAIEWQRLLAPTMAAEWSVFHGSGNVLLPTNDVAHTIMKHPVNGSICYAIPVSPTCVLALSRQTVRTMLRWDEESLSWVAPINHYELTDENFSRGRRALQESSQFEIYGPTKESVEFVRDPSVPVPIPAGGALIVPTASSRALIPYIEDYFMLLTLVERTPKELIAGAIQIDFQVVSQYWGGMVQIPINVPRFPGGIFFFREGHIAGEIGINMTRYSEKDVLDGIRQLAEQREREQREIPADSAALDEATEGNIQQSRPSPLVVEMPLVSMTPKPPQETGNMGV